MPTHHVYHCPASPDVELGLPRPNPLRYDVAWPDASNNNQPPGLLLLIPGFGQDNDDGYLQAFREWVADRFGMGCMTVSYHGVHNRPQQGAHRQFAQDDLIRLAQTCQAHGIPWPQPPAVPDLMQLLGQLDHAHNQRNAAAQARGESPESLILTCGLRSTDGPINLGLPQALDHLAALHDLQQHHAYDPANVIALGSSHGGYLAGLLNKLAPNTLRAVFDNSGYATLPLRYVDSRHANLGPDFFENHSPTFRFAYYVESAWNLNPNLPNTYHDDARQLRDLAHATHLSTTFADVPRPAAIRCVHAPGDNIAPTAEKQAYIESLQQRGLDATLQVFTESDVDGSYVKSLDHGLGLSLRTFFQSQLDSLPPVTQNYQNDAARNTTLRFQGESSSLTIHHTPTGVQASIA
ncbi:MAG: DUF2920 family protein [Planctomycetota bacterium]